MVNGIIKENFVENTSDYWKSLDSFPGLGRKLKVAVALPNRGGCAYYRNILPYTKLAELYSNVVEVRFDENILGINTKASPKDKSPWLPNWEWEIMRWADIVVTNNISNFGGPYTARICGKSKEFGKIFHYDTDDLLTQLFEKHRLAGVYKEGLSDLTKFIYTNSDIITVTQKKFQERIAPFMGKGMLAVVKNCIDYTLPCWSAQKTKVPKDKFVRIGWAGGIHHEEDVKAFSNVPYLVNQKVGIERVRWDFYGKPPVDPNDPKEKWQLDVWDNYEKVFARGFGNKKNYTINSAMPSDSYGYMYSNMDVAIAPLQMNEFNDCYSKGTRVIMYDGSLKEVENINFNDKLLGPDSTPRNVQRLSCGKNIMYKIIPKRGESFNVTENHILVLKLNDSKTLKWKKSRYKQYLNITVKDYLNSTNFIKQNYRLFKTNCLTFENSINNKLDSYFVGMMLGDGTFKGCPKVTTMDKEIKEYFESYCLINYPSLKIHEDRKEDNRAATYSATKILMNNHIENPLMMDIKSIGLAGVICEDKFIPDSYKYGCESDRKKVLAGLIDTDGSLQSNKTVYTFTNKSKKLVEDVIFVARSLGLYCTPIKDFKVPTICDTVYWRTQISGDTHLIPCKLTRKQAVKRKVNRDPLTSSFKVEHLGIKEFYGFELDKDHLHLLDNFTVVHNSKSDIKVAECVAYGVPLIASDVGCYNETIVNGKTGFLIPPDSPESEWTRPLSILIKNKDLREEMGKNLCKLKDQFDANKVIHHRLYLYKKFFEWKNGQSKV